MEVAVYQLNPLQIKFVDGHHSNREWVNLYAGYRQQLLKLEQKVWLLYEPDTFIFSALFYALLSAKKSILLPQNAQGEHLRQVKKMAHASIGCASIEPDLLSTLEWPEAQVDSIEISAQAEIIFLTSGSTGQAKVIRKYYAQLQIEVETLESTFAAEIHNSVFMSTISHQHIYGLLYKLLWPFSKNHAVVCQAFEYPEHIVAKIEQQHFTKVSLIASPAHLHRLKLDNILLTQKEAIHRIFSSGGPLDASCNIVLQQQLSCQLIEVYGSTETGGIAWRKRASETDEIWHTFVGMAVSYQPDSDLLLLQSPYVMESHYAADDRIELLNHQQFRLLGRADDVVKVEEKRISLDEVRLRLKQHDYINDAYVLIVGQRRKQLAAVIELSEEGLQHRQNLSAHQFNRQFQLYLSQWFEAVTLPKKFRYPLQLPYNAQGKINRLTMESYFE
jgi:acyl-coenzyme A synthetase/AMP-(fatty) acid ligase